MQGNERLVLCTHVNVDLNMDNRQADLLCDLRSFDMFCSSFLPTRRASVWITSLLTSHKIISIVWVLDFRVSNHSAVIMSGNLVSGVLMGIDRVRLIVNSVVVV